MHFATRGKVHSGAAAFHGDDNTSSDLHTPNFPAGLAIPGSAIVA